MPQFMVMILENEAEERKLAPSETKALVEGHSAYERNLRAASAYLDGGRLRPSAEGKRVGNRDGQPRIEAGPFGDKALSGYYASARPGWLLFAGRRGGKSLLADVVGCYEAVVPDFPGILRR